jgi:NADH-quinone oxidoreductase subunit J
MDVFGIEDVTAEAELLAALVTASHVGRRSNPLRKQTTLDNRNQGGNS